MTWPVILAISISLLSVAVCCGVVYACRRRTRATMERMEAMLDAAIGGSFSETMFDESLLSAVETRLAHYISASAVSAQSLREDKEKIKSLLGDISHQTKTPIANILLYAQLLEEQALPEESRICVDAINGQAAKLRFLIGALIKTSRLETGVFQLTPKPTPVQGVLDAALAQIAPDAKNKQLRVLCTQTDAAACMDGKWTEEALYNILDNAVKYTPSGGKIEIATTTYQFFCRIDIADTGIGIAEAEQAQIFSRFYRSPAVSDTQGIGIGLYLARQIIAAQGGYIKVFSDGRAGAQFSVFLPLQP